MSNAPPRLPLAPRASTDFLAVKAGFWSRYRKPALIDIRDIQIHIKYCQQLDLLAKAIAYSLVTPIEQRNTLEWSMAKNTVAAKATKEWNSVAAYFKVTKPTKFSDLILIDFSLLNDLDESIIGIVTVKKKILTELKLLSYVRK